MKAALINNNARAQRNLGDLYISGKLGQIDYVKAEQYYLKAAEQNDAEAQRVLGWIYENGKLGKVDYDKAYKWYSKAAENGNARGQCNLGRCYDYGMGVKKDYSKAIEWYKKSVNNNFARSNYFLGICYEEGKGVDKNLETAFQCYKKGADALEPDADCCFKIAEAYYAKRNPHGVAKTGALLALSVLIPVTNVVTIPAAIIGAGVNAAMKYDKFVKTDAGKDMMKYYRKAASLGHEKAKERVNELEVYEK